MNRRLAGWLLVLVTPGLAAGVALTLFYAASAARVRLPLTAVNVIGLGLYAVATVAPAAGGYLAAPASKGGRRFALGVAGGSFGAVAFASALAVGERVLLRR